MAPRFGLNAYRDADIESTAFGGNSAGLVVALYEGIICALGEARIHFERGELLEAGRRCSKALMILAGLRETLDFERGDPVASQLLKFYNSVTSRLISAQIRRDTEVLRELAALVESVKSAWQELAQMFDREGGKKFLASELGALSKPTAVALSGAGAAAVS